MTLIRCTAKLRKEMGLTPSGLHNQTPSTPLGEWHAQLFYEGGKKCVLFVAEHTLLCFLRPNLRRERIRKLDEEFRDGLFRLLLDEGFEARQAERVFEGAREVRYGGTTDRSLTGTANELVKETQFWLPRMGGVAAPDLAPLHNKLNRTPFTRNQYAYAIDATRELLGG